MNASMAWGLTKDALLTRLRNEVGDIPTGIWHCPCGCGHAVAFARDLRGLWVVPTWMIPIAGSLQKKVTVRVMESESEIGLRIWTDCPDPYPEVMNAWLACGLAETLTSAFRGTQHDNGLRAMLCGVCQRGRLVELAQTSAFRSPDCGVLHSVPRCAGFLRQSEVTAEMAN